ncbi:MAG TPA: Fic family protein [Solirubrobacterales bacterium]|nr:Fic family protein [Solirubrobacterales bacterium]
MRSFVDLDKTFSGQPRELGAILSRIDTGRGQERLFEDQAPELLKRLSEDARIASITASNAIEGVVVEEDRATRIAEGARFRNRNEREFAGYRDAVDTLMRKDDSEALSVPFVLALHRMLFEHTNGRGGHLKTDQNLIVSFETGRREVIFTPAAPEETEFLLTELLVRYEAAQADARTHPLVLIGALVLDLLAIHPVADGNGRLARLVTTHELLAQGYGVTRYISIEQRVFESKNAYYASLYESQRGWHEGEHNIWPWITFLARTVDAAYVEFGQRVASSREESGGKQERVRHYILEEAPAEFRRRDIERALPGVSNATIRLALNQLRDAGQIKVVGSGPSAHWAKSEESPP